MFPRPDEMRQLFQRPAVLRAVEQQPGGRVRGEGQQREHGQRRVGGKEDLQDEPNTATSQVLGTTGDRQTLPTYTCIG